MKKLFHDGFVPDRTRVRWRMIQYNSNYKKYSIILFYVLFAIWNFNALIQIFVPRILYTVLYILVLLVSVFEFVKQKKFRLSKDAVSKNLLVLIFIMICLFRFLIQVIMGDYTELSLNRFLQTLVPVLVYFPATFLEYEDREGLEVFYIKCALLSVLLGLLNQITGILPSRYFADEMVRIGNYVTTRSYSMAGFSLGTGTICSIGIALLLKNRDKFNITFKLVSAIVFIYGLAVTFSRGGVLFAVIIITVFTALNFSFSGNKINKFTLVSLIVLLLCFIIAVSVYGDKIFQSAFWERYVLNAFDSSTSLRSNFQRKALELIKTYPLFGRGFGFVGSNAYSMSIGESFPPENNYYQMAIDCGLIAMCSYMLFALKAVFYELKMQDKEKIAYVGIVSGFMLWSWMSTPLEGDLNAAFFWYCIGSLVS